MVSWSKISNFETEEKIVKVILNQDQILPSQVFLSEFHYFSICDFGFTCTDEFITDLRNYSIKTNTFSKFNLIVLEPDPKKYFYHNFSKYPLIKMSIEILDEEYLEVLNEDPGGSPADSIASVATTLIYYSDDMRLAIYGNNDYEICIAAFRSKSDHLRFLSSVGKVPWISMSQAIEDFYTLERLSEREKKLLIQNYQ